ncbi:F-box only protein 9 isoform X2 [Bacillus rossius redtenbacheri]|uniref:F-box only protein 9 isoform X2 n=1 Tax=Bacillus rossius redtenbacheri TaxID=93214 RepID=UPI002FDDE479
MSNPHYQNASPTAVPSAAAGASDTQCAFGVGQDSGGDGVEGEDQEEESSNEKEDGDGPSAEDALTIFRDQWQRELGAQPQKKMNDAFAGEKLSDNKADTYMDKAKTLFLQGVENERNRKFYEAIQCYRRAVQLVPDIEFQLYEASKPKMRERQDATTAEELETSLEHGSDGNASTDEEDEEEEGKDGSLLSRLLRIFSRCRCTCIPQTEQKTTHISALPFEILLYILRWVVSSELDIRSLEQCAGVCRGFYLCSRDEEIWRLACVRVWGVHCGGLTNYESWRRMFIDRPHLQFNGCYISKTTYIRPGENSFRDQFYRSWHVVEYYRYLRFFPDGLVLMLTTPDEPATSLQQLRYRMPRNPTVLSGHYRLHDDCVVIALQRQNLSGNNRYRARRREAAPELAEQTFNIELKIMNHRHRMNVQLAWQFYSVYVQYRNGQGSSTKFDLPASRYPPFWFSRVKSYGAVSESPLQ